VVVERLRMFIAGAEQSGEKVEKIALPAAQVAALRKELGPAGDADALVFEGVPIVVMDRRDELIGLAVEYARVRWDWGIGHEVASLLNKVPTEDLPALAACIVDQAADAAGREDPSEDLDADTYDDWLRAVRGIGLEVSL
jgi:hypothetical protein